VQVGDLVKWRGRPPSDSQPVGIALIEGGGAWWTILWTNGEREIVSERNLKVVNESR